MIFNEEELTAVAKLGILMIEADYVESRHEVNTLIADINRISGREDGEKVLKNARNLNHINMIDTISHFDNCKKRFTVAFLMSVMMADKEAENEEISLLYFASNMCGLPRLTLAEAKKLIKFPTKNKC